MGRLGPGEIALIAVLALMLFGSSRLSEAGKGLGDAIRNFRRGLTQEDDEPTLPSAPLAATIIVPSPIVSEMEPPASPPSTPVA